MTSKDGGIGGALYIKVDSSGNPKLFKVNRNHDGSPWLNTNWDKPDNVWNPDNQWVFLRRKSLYFSLGLGRGSFVFIALLTSLFLPLSVIPAPFGPELMAEGQAGIPIP